MPVVTVHRYYEPPSQSGGTLSVTTFDLTNPFVFQLQPGTFNATGVWTLINFTTLTGSLSNLTLDTSALGFVASSPYQAGNSIKVVLS
jgi:hypothetical protein